MSAANRVTTILAAPLMVTALAFSIASHGDGAHDHSAQLSGTYGTVDFQVSCDTRVRADFDRALGLMHHMMYEQARGAFEAITEADPDCAMAYWGIATTLFQPLWGTRPSQEDLDRGWQAVRKAKERPGNERERGLIEATEGFFREPESADFHARINRWIEGMENAWRAHPDDADTAALYALSRLTLAQRAEDRGPLHDEAESILREVYEEHPTHPGAIHYTIHATDADGRAENAPDIVEVYGEIAPEIPHALHMPSHIYVRLGDWPAVIDWNRRSADAVLREHGEGPVSFHYIHALDYMAYAYLQQGEDDKARAVIEEALDKDRHQASLPSAFHIAAMPARFAVERRQWEEATALTPRSPDYLPWDDSQWPEGLTWYARGLGGVHGGDLAIAAEAEGRLEVLRDEARSAGDDNFADYIEIDRKILSGWIAHLRGDSEQAVELMQEAAALERTIEKHPVTPGALLPPNEALGDLLMELDQPVEALAAYQASEAIWPGRYNTLLGATRAASEAGDKETARKHLRRLLEITGDGPQRPGLAELKATVEG